MESAEKAPVAVADLGNGLAARETSEPNFIWTSPRKLRNGPAYYKDASTLTELMSLEWCSFTAGGHLRQLP